MYITWHCSGHVFQYGCPNIDCDGSILSKMTSLESLTLKTYTLAPASWQCDLYFGTRIITIHPLLLKISVLYVLRQPCFSKMAAIHRLWWFYPLESDIIGIPDPENLYFGTRIMTIHEWLLKICELYVLWRPCFSKWPPKHRLWWFYLFKNVINRQ